MAKPDLGTKRTCPNCGSKYYDLNRNPITCPSCGTIFEVAAPARAERPAPEKKPEKPKETAEVEREEGVVSLEDAEPKAAEDIGPDEDEGDEEAIPDVEVDTEIEDDSSEEDTFLEEDEEEGDDVSGLLDVDAEDEDEP